MTAPSVIIPAHDEERTVGRTLGCLLGAAEPDEFEVVVVCNGCRDDTAAAARRAAPGATVIEIAEASKVAALNAGDLHATRFPRIYLDADVELATAAARAVATELASGVLCASVQADYDCSGASWVVRRYFQVWQGLPHFASGPIGGAYGLSEEGRARFGPFPDLIADDQFVTQLFTAEERRVVPGPGLRVFPPRDTASLVRTRTRVYRGNRQLASAGLARYPAVGGAGPVLARMVRHPRNWPAVAVYVAVTATAKVLARRASAGWERDDSTRRPAAAQPGRR